MQGLNKGGMMVNTIRIYCDFVYLNEYINTERRNKYAAAKIKDKLTNEVAWQCKSKRCHKPTGKVDMIFKWHVKGRHDSDNIAFAKKFVLDGMVQAGLLENDNPKCVRHLKDYIYRDVKKPNLDYVEVYWEEIKDE